ncbi:MAG: adenosylhomocysteine nucleosidase [Pseudonocardiales bacterium]|nr:adenosylhomocysteine nucleosidase [Pseudonocardiales bacterium]
MIVMLTALEVEYAAVRAHLSGITTHHHASGTLFEIGHVGGCEIALALTGMGNTGAATLTERAITEFEPDVVMFVGVAGGLATWLELGDVVVATRVYGYHGGRETAEEFRARPRAWELQHHVEQLARHVARSFSGPRVEFQPIAAGEVVLNSTSAPLARQINRHYDDAVAVEMESAGVANAAHLNMATPTVTVRGISDLVDGKDASDLQGWQPIAAANAAKFAVTLAGALSTPRAESRRGKGKAQPVGDIVFNNHGSVGNQVGTNNGTINMSQNQARERLNDLTTVVVRAHQAGQLDLDLFSAAMVALDEARNSTGPIDLRRIKVLLGGIPAVRPVLDSIVDSL